MDVLELGSMIDEQAESKAIAIAVNYCHDFVMWNEQTQKGGCITTQKWSFHGVGWFHAPVVLSAVRGHGGSSSLLFWIFVVHYRDFN